MRDLFYLSSITLMCLIITIHFGSEVDSFARADAQAAFQQPAPQVASISSPDTLPSPDSPEGQGLSH